MSCSTSPTTQTFPSTLPRCDFLRLPLEIREIIYEHLLNQPYRLDLSVRKTSHWARYPTAFLCVCKQVHEEATRVLYGHDVFYVDVKGTKYLQNFTTCGDEGCIRSGQPCWVHPRNLPLIRNLRINIFSYYSRGQDIMTFRNLARVCSTFAELPPLRTLVVKYQMLLGEEAEIAKPMDAEIITGQLRGPKTIADPDVSELAFMNSVSPNFEKILLALTLLRSTRSVTIEPLNFRGRFCAPYERMVLGSAIFPPPLTEEYAHYLSKTILVSSKDRNIWQKPDVEDDATAYDSGAEL